jgi:hypothetical protein
VVALRALLCTAVAIGSQRAQSFWLAQISRRYCSIHRFFRSDRLSVWGWNAVDRFCVIPSAWMMAFPKWEVKRGSRSLMILRGSPNHRNTFSRYSFTILAPVIVVVQGRNTAPREQPWSAIVRIASNPSLLGNPVIRSMAMCENGLALMTEGM